MLPIATLIALSLGYIVAGAILVETVFSWPGIGRAVYDAVLAARLPDAAGSVPGADGLGRLLQPRRRPPLLQARSEDHGMSEASFFVESRRRRARPAARSLFRKVRRQPGGSDRSGDPRGRHPHRDPRALDRALRPAHAGRAGRSGHPSWSHPLGLDDGGIDMVTLLMWGVRISLVVGFAATFVSMVIGGTIGLVSPATSAARPTRS